MGSLIILFVGCLETDGNLKSQGTLGSNTSAIGADEVGAGVLPAGVLLGSVNQLPIPMNGSSCSASQILEWNGGMWMCVDTPSSSGNPGVDTVDSSAILDGSILSLDLSIDAVNSSKVLDGSLLGDDVQNNSIDATTKLSTTCSDDEFLRASGGTFNCVSSAGGADNLGDHTATQNLNLAGFQLVGNGGSLGITVANTGNVGVGTTSPTKALHVVTDGSTGTPALFEREGDTDVADSVLTLVKSVTGGGGGATSGGAGLLFKAPDSSGASRFIGGVTALFDNATAGSLERRIILSAGGQVTSNMEDNVDAVHVLENGNVGLGVIDPQNDLDIVQDDFASLSVKSNSSRAVLFLDRATSNEEAYVRLRTNGSNVWAFGARPDGSNDFVFYDSLAGGNRLTIKENTGRVGIGTQLPSHLLHVNGVARSTQANWATQSDKRVKANIQKFDNGLNYIERLNPVTFFYKKDFAQGKEGLDKLQYGFIAQEVREQLPELGAVSLVKEKVAGESLEDFHILDTSSFMALVVSGIKSLKKQLKNLFDSQSELEKRVLFLEEENKRMSFLNQKLTERLFRLESVVEAR